MTSRLEIFNQAVARCGSGEVLRDPDADETTEEECRRHYTAARRLTLASFAWGFATRYSTATPLADEIPGPWAKWFEMPSGVLRVLGVYPKSGPFDQSAEYKVLGWKNTEGRDIDIIGSNEPSISLHAIHDISTESLFSPHFADALAWKLAAEIAPTVADSRGYRAEAIGLWRDAIETAKIYDARQSYSNEVEPASLVARG